jgi:hypothetical protein
MSLNHYLRCYALACEVMRERYDRVPLLQAQELAKEIERAIEKWFEAEGK